MPNKSGRGVAVIHHFESLTGEKVQTAFGKGEIYVIVENLEFDRFH
jgi:hypothetical protein